MSYETKYKYYRLWSLIPIWLGDIEIHNLTFKVLVNMPQPKERRTERLTVEECTYRDYTREYHWHLETAKWKLEF